MTRRKSLALMAGPAAAQVLPDRGPDAGGGRFLREWWYVPGIENGNPVSNGRFRVNAPEVMLHPAFSIRTEAKSSGMLQILVDEAPREIAGAELYLELWGGHPGTANKRVTPNGRTTYYLPEVGAPAGRCTHHYPVVKLKPSDLVPGYNAFQFAVDQGSTFWGEFIVDEACVRCELPSQHPAIAKSGLSAFSARLESARSTAGEAFDLALLPQGLPASAISRVEIRGFYEGYDENGNTQTRDWHGFTTKRKPVAYVGSAEAAPFRVRWDTSMLPEQREMAVKAIVYFREHPGIVYETRALGGLLTPSRGTSRVSHYGMSTRPAPFWSRANNKRVATITLDAAPDLIEKAELHVVVWDGGRGNVKDYFTLNGQQFDVARDARHNTIYSVLSVPPALLRKGLNEIVLLSDTEHHGIEVLEPGPALVLRGPLPLPPR